MKLSAFLLAFAISITSSQAAGYEPEKVPAELVKVETLGPHRLLVFQVCSPEHCWNQLFVQVISDSLPQRIVCSKPIVELNDTSDTIVRSITSRDKPKYSLELSLGSSHGAFDETTATLSLSLACKYKIRVASARAANNSFKPTPLRGVGKAS